MSTLAQLNLSILARDESEVNFQPIALKKHFDMWYTIESSQILTNGIPAVACVMSTLDQTNLIFFFDTW